MIPNNGEGDSGGAFGFVEQIGPRSVEFFKSYARLDKEGYFVGENHIQQFAEFGREDENFSEQARRIAKQSGVAFGIAILGLLYLRATERTLVLQQPLTLPHLN